MLPGGQRDRGRVLEGRVLRERGRVLGTERVLRCGRLWLGSAGGQLESLSNCPGGTGAVRIGTFRARTLERELSGSGPFAPGHLKGTLESFSSEQGPAPPSQSLPRRSTRSAGPQQESCEQEFQKMIRVPQFGHSFAIWLKGKRDKCKMLVVTGSVWGLRQKNILRTFRNLSMQDEQIPPGNSPPADFCHLTFVFDRGFCDSPKFPP